MRKPIEVRIPVSLAMEIGFSNYLQETIKRLSKAGMPLKLTAMENGTMNFKGILHGKLHAFMDGTDRVYVWTPTNEETAVIIQHDRPMITGDIILGVDHGN